MVRERSRRRQAYVLGRSGAPCRSVAATIKSPRRDTLPVIVHEGSVVCTPDRSAVARAKAALLLSSRNRRAPAAGSVRIPQFFQPRSRSTCELLVLLLDRHGALQTRRTISPRSRAHESCTHALGCGSSPGVQLDLESLAAADLASHRDVPQNMAVPSQAPRRAANARAARGPSIALTVPSGKRRIPLRVTCDAAPPIPMPSTRRKTSSCR